MIRFKGCPKCKGDVVIDSDQYGWYEQCMQCGYMSDLQNIVEVPEQGTEIKKRKPPEPIEQDDR